uniref:Putative secreted protein n=1 Tax=Anopheles marajoara TaxID=58244 RepID=A0A2M4CBS3_9DIPT
MRVWCCVVQEAAATAAAAAAAGKKESGCRSVADPPSARACSSCGKRWEQSRALPPCLSLSHTATPPVPAPVLLLLCTEE